MYKLYYQLLLLLGNIKKLFFINQYSAGENFHLYAMGGIVGKKKKIIIGNNVNLYGWLISDGGTIVVHDNVHIHPGTVIRSMNYIEIGKYCDIGGESYIQDHNSESLNYLDRREQKGTILNAPIKIGNDVWIGRRVAIFKGVTIGDRAVIGANAVVTRDIPSDVVAVGNPTRVVKKL